VLTSIVLLPLRDTQTMYLGWLKALEASADANISSRATEALENAPVELAGWSIETGKVLTAEPGAYAAQPPSSPDEEPTDHPVVHDKENWFDGTKLISLRDGTTLPGELRESGGQSTTAERRGRGVVRQHDCGKQYLIAARYGRLAVTEDDIMSVEEAPTEQRTGPADSSSESPALRPIATSMRKLPDLPGDRQRMKLKDGSVVVSGIRALKYTCQITTRYGILKAHPRHILKLEAHSPD